MPGFVATVRYRDGIARTIAALDSDPARQQVDEALEAHWDRLIAAYERGLVAAQAGLRG